MTSERSALLSQVVSESEICIDSWADYELFSKDLGHARGRWCFRGHRRSDWNLESSLERLTRGNRDRIRAEKLLIRSFQRRAHHFVSDLPSPDDLLEWLALMQHWGVPTRLLDFTMSPYVALFFALNEFLETANENGKQPQAAIWAVNHVLCKGIAARTLNEKLGAGDDRFSHSTLLGAPEFFKRIFFSDDAPYLVAPVQPSRLSKRHENQQGLFLCPSNLKWTLETTFVQSDAMQNFLQHRGGREHDSPPDMSRENVVRQNLKQLVRKAAISERGAREILPRLYSMNLNSGTLFPDMQGFARSIKERYLSLQLLPDAEKQIVGFDCIDEFDALG